MKITKKGWAFLSLVFLHLLAVILIALISESTSVPRTIVRVMGLSALIVMFYAAIIALFLKSIIKNFGKSFIKIHHTFALSGFILLAIHGILYATLLSTGLSLELWIVFSLNADICAILAITAAIKRKSWTKIWRYIHMLMYLMLFFATLHGIFGGTDFRSPAILIIYITMLIALVFSFILKRKQMSNTK